MLEILENWDFFLTIFKLSESFLCCFVVNPHPKSWAKKGQCTLANNMWFYILFFLCDPIFRNEHRRWWSLPNHIFTLYEPMVMPLKKVRKWRIIWQEFEKCPNLLQQQQLACLTCVRRGQKLSTFQSSSWLHSGSKPFFFGHLKTSQFWKSRT